MINTSKQIFLSLVTVIVLFTGRVVFTECPTWDELYMDDSLIELTISDPSMAGLRMWFVYVNPPILGRCTLGHEPYNEVRESLLKDPSTQHLFWVGLEGDLLDLFRTERFYMIQGDRRLDVMRRLDLNLPTGLIQNGPSLSGEALLLFKGVIDFTEPVTIFYEGVMGSVPGEYWFSEKYVDLKH